MKMPTTRTLQIDLGDVQEAVDARVASGAYASASEVLCAGMQALEREEAAFDEGLRHAVTASIEDPRASLSSDDVFASLEQEYRQDVSARKRAL